MQTYGPQNLFEHGREIEIPQKITGGKKQRRKGKRSDAPQATCEHCAKRFKPDKKAKGVYCSRQCMFDFRIKQEPEWLKCSGCFAKLGIGMDKTAQIFRTTKQRVLAHWRKHGIKACPPKIGSWLLYRNSVLSNEVKDAGWWGTEDDGRAWMTDHKAKYPDWTSIWTKAQCSRYQSRRHRESGKDSAFRLKKICRSRIYNAIKRSNNGVKPRIAYRTEKMIGCPIPHLVRHLEAKFKKGMTWDNHGTKWHIDHVIPCAEFDFTDEKQILQCSHYTNLQPMWAAENWAKGDKILKDTQMNLAIFVSH